MLPRCAAGGITPGKRRSVYPTWRGNAHGRRGTKLDCRRVLCHRQCGGQDTTGQNSIIEAYLARLADFTGEFANSTNRPIRFSSPSRQTGEKDLRLFDPPQTVPPGRADIPIRINRVPSVEKDAGTECDRVGNPSRLIRSGLGPQYPATRCTELGVIQVGLIWQSRRWTPAPSGRECGTSSEMNVRLSCVMLRGAQDVSK
jgi:hypothetical protein